MVAFLADAGQAAESLFPFSLPPNKQVPLKKVSAIDKTAAAAKSHGPTLFFPERLFLWPSGTQREFEVPREEKAGAAAWDMWRSQSQKGAVAA
jgi:hypothetical protein